MSDIMINSLEILTAKVVAEIAWKALQKGCALTKEVFREPLKKWILEERELDILVNSIENASPGDKRTAKYLEAYLDAHTEVQRILKNAKADGYHVKVHQSHSVQSPIAGRDIGTIIYNVTPDPEKKN